jgi:hypothetical protein
LKTKILRIIASRGNPFFEISIKINSNGLNNKFFRASIKLNTSVAQKKEFENNLKSSYLINSPKIYFGSYS